MSRQDWHAFISSPQRAGRHLSSIGRGVAGSQADAIDLNVLQAFLERLNDSADATLLGSAVDLICGGYCDFVETKLSRLLDSLSNEMLAQQQVVGPGLRGNPIWDKTILGRLSGSLSRTHFVSRTAHRSFDLPENQLLAWLLTDLVRAVDQVEYVVGSSRLHPQLRSLQMRSEAAQNHHWLGSIPSPLRPTSEMIAAARRHRREEYRSAAKLATRRLELQANDREARWYTVLSLLAVNWLEPLNDDDLFELYVLLLTIDVIALELGFGEPIEYGLVTSRRGHVAKFECSRGSIEVFFDQSATTALGIRTMVQKVIASHSGISGSSRRPDIILRLKDEAGVRVALVEMKRTDDGRYVSDSIYKVFGYLFDYRSLGEAICAVLVVPEGVASVDSGVGERPMFVTSGSDRTDFVAALKSALRLH